MPSRLGSETPFAPDNTPVAAQKGSAVSVTDRTATRMPADPPIPHARLYAGGHCRAPWRIRRTCTSSRTSYTATKGSGANTTSRVPSTRPRRPRSGNVWSEAMPPTIVRAIRRAESGLLWAIFGWHVLTNNCAEGVEPLPIRSQRGGAPVAKILPLLEEPLSKL